jgi:putative nucleotidyltransferase with HDIG domain
VENGCYVGFYQPLTWPGQTSRTNERRILNSRARGLTATATLYPFRGRMQDIRIAFTRFLDGSPPVLAAYWASLVVLAFGICVWSYAAYGGIESIWPVITLAAVAAIAERASAQLGDNLEASVSMLATVFAAVLFGPLEALVVAAASMVGDFRPPHARWAVYTVSRSVTGGVTGLVAIELAASADRTLGSVLLVAAAASLTASVLDVGLAAITMRLRGTSSIRVVVSTCAPAIGASIPLYAPLVAALAFAYQELSAWTLPLFFIPALAAQRLFVLYEHQRELTDDLLAAKEQLEQANMSFAAALVATLDARDQYTAGHSAAVAVYARDIAARMGLTSDQQRLAHLCGLVHDIGKIGLPPGLLDKPGSLTLEERREMEKHAEIGERILAKVEDYSEIANIVRHHHERVDGEGYPDRLASDEIPPISRILAVADAYNAMTSDRPYRDAMPSRVARLRLAQAADSQFDTSVVAAFEAILAGASEDYRSGTRLAFDFEGRHAVTPATAAA